MTETQRLLADIEAFLAAHRMAASTFGRLSCRDVHAVRRLRDGCSLTLRRVDQMRIFMREYTPPAPKARVPTEATRAA